MPRSPDRGATDHPVRAGFLTPDVLRRPANGAVAGGCGAGVTVRIPYAPLPLEQSGVEYLHGPDSVARSGVPVGTVTAYESNDSAVYPGVVENLEEPDRSHRNAEYDAFDDRTRVS